MPKIKSKSSAKKRFTLTGTGKIKRKHAYKSHILTKKSTKRKRNLTYTTTVDTSDEKRVREMLSKQYFLFINLVYSTKDSQKSDERLNKKQKNDAKISKRSSFKS